MAGFSLDTQNGTLDWAWYILGALWGGLMLLYGGTFGWLHKRIIAVEEKCHECPATMITQRNVAIEAAEERVYNRTRDMFHDLTARVDQVDANRDDRFDRLQAQIVAAMHPTPGGGYPPVVRRPPQSSPVSGQSGGLWRAAKFGEGQDGDTT